MTEVEQASREVEVCLICKHGLINAKDIHESRTSFSKTLLAVKLGEYLLIMQHILFIRHVWIVLCY